MNPANENPIAAVYRGLVLGDAEMSQGIVEWVEPRLTDNKSPAAVVKCKQWWGGVTASIAGVTGTQTVSFAASAVAQYGTANIACSTLASATLQAAMDVEDDYVEIGYITATQTGPGTYHLSIGGYGFGDDGGNFLFGGVQYATLSWSDTDIEVDVTATDGVCESYSVEIDPDEDYDPLRFEEFGPESVGTTVELCPDVSAPTFTISVLVKSSATGKAMPGVAVSMTDSCNSNLILTQHTDVNGMYDYIVSAGCSYTLTAGYLNYYLTPNVVSVPAISADVIANFFATPIKTVFLLHGIGQGPGDMAGLAISLQGATGIDPARYRVDAGFDFALCAAVGNASCAASCGISGGAQLLATYIASVAPPGDIILVGFSLGGVIARDLILNNYSGVLSGRKISLVTLATPSLGYPYADLDSLAFCPYLVEPMSGNWRYLQANGWPLLSEYLSPTTQSWQAASFPGASGFWLAAYGQSCSQPIRNANPSVIPTGCANASRTTSPTSDGVVCADSAGFNISTPAGTGPNMTWSDPAGTYVHSNAGAGLATAFLLCTNPPNSNLLSSPPATGGLFQTIVAAINGR